MVKYYGRARQRVGSVNTNQIGLKMSGCPSKVGRKGTIDRYISQRVSCLRGICGGSVVNGLLWNVHKLQNNPPFCATPSSTCLAAAGGIGNIYTPYYKCNKNQISNTDSWHPKKDGAWCYRHCYYVTLLKEYNPTDGSYYWWTASNLEGDEEGTGRITGMSQTLQNSFPNTDAKLLQIKGTQTCSPLLDGAPCSPPPPGPVYLLFNFSPGKERKFYALVKSGSGSGAYEFTIKDISTFPRNPPAALGVPDGAKGWAKLDLPAKALTTGLPYNQNTIAFSPTPP